MDWSQRDDLHYINTISVYCLCNHRKIVDRSPVYESRARAELVRSRNKLFRDEVVHRVLLLSLRMCVIKMLWQIERGIGNLVDFFFMSLRMCDTYIIKLKFDSIRISGIRDIKKISNNQLYKTTRHGPGALKRATI